MPYKVPQPTDNQFASYLEELLGGFGQGFNVNMQPAQVDQNGNPIPGTGFFHITKKSSQGLLKTNLKLDLGHESDFRTTYGGRATEQFERAPELFARDSKRWVFGGSMPAQATVSKTKTGGPYKGYDVNVRHELRSPVESLAAMIGTAFSDVEKENAFSGSSKTVDVTSKIMSMLSAGSGENSSYDIPGGALMVAPGIDSDAIRRKAAKSISLVNTVDRNAPVDTFTQLEAIRKSRENLLLSGESVTARGGRQIDSFFQEGGYAPDRDQENRLVSWAQASRAVTDDVGQPVGTEIYLPTPKIKHATISWTGRQQAVPLDKNMQPLDAKPIGRGLPTSGYRQTTADIGGRIPAQSLVLGTLFSPQYPIPGAGMFFHENMDADIASGGYKTPARFGVTQNVRGLINNDIKLELAQQVGNVIPSTTSFDVYRMRTKDMKDTDPSMTLSERAGTHSFVLKNQQLRIPQYYNPEGMGVSYDSDALRKKQITQVSQKQIDMLQKRLGVPVQVDPTISDVSLEMQGYSKVGGKMAIGSVKSELTPEYGKPSIAVGNRNLGIGALTWETKQILDTFTTSLGTISPTAQYGILGEYAKSLQASEKTDEAATVRGFVKDLREARTDAPGARMDIQSLANRVMGTTSQAPAQEVARDIFQRVFLGGMTAQEFGEQSEADISAFGQSERNLKNLSRFGIGYVTPEMTSPINKMWDQAQVEQMATEYVRGSKGMDPKAARARFAQQYGFDLNNAKGGMVAQSFRPQGFFMPALAGPSVEFSGGGVLGSEEAQVLNAIAPNFAKRLGISLEDVSGKGSLAMNRRDPVRWAQAQMAHLAMAEMDRDEGKYINIPNALTIGSEQATKMFADPEFRGMLSKDSADLATMRQFEEKLKGFFPGSEDLDRRPIQFESLPGRYLPSTRAVGAMATENQATTQGELRTGQDVTRTWNMFQSAFAQGLTSQINEDPVGIQEGTEKMTSHMMKQFGLPEGSKRDVIKKMMGTQVGVSSGHYAYWQELKQNEVYASKEKYMEAIRRELTAQGMDTPEKPLTEQEVEQAYNMIAGLPSTVGSAPKDVRVQGVPGIAARWPIVGGDEAMLGMRFITQEHLQRSGRTAPPEAGLGNLHWRIGVGPSAVMQGDFDLDYMFGLMGLKGQRDTEGNLQMSFAGYSGNRLDKGMRDLIRRTSEMDYGTLQSKLFPSQKSQEQFNPILQAFADRDPDRQLGTLQQVAKGLIGTQFGKAGYVPYGDFLESAEDYRKAKQMMGTSYNFTRALEASAGLAGWGTGGIMEGRRGRAQLYQPHLDLTTSQAAPLVRMYQSSYLSTAEKTGKLGLGWGADTDRGLQFIRSAGTVNELSTQNVGTLMTMMAGSAIQPSASGELPSPSLLSYAFSPEENRMNTEDVQASETAYRKYQQALQDPDRYEQRGQLLDEYYKSTGLTQALEVPYGMEGDTTQRATAMQDTLTGWMKANYYGDEKGRQQVFRGNMLTAMFSKAYNRKLQDPDWQVPQQFQSSRLGAQMIMKANVHQPLFNMMKGGLASGSKLMNLVNSMQGSSGLNVWAQGNILKQFGLGEDKFEFPQSRFEQQYGIDQDTEHRLAKDFADAKINNQFAGNFDDYVAQQMQADKDYAAASAAKKPTSPTPDAAFNSKQWFQDIPLEDPGGGGIQATTTPPPDTTTTPPPADQPSATTPPPDNSGVGNVSRPQAATPSRPTPKPSGTGGTGSTGGTGNTGGAATPTGGQSRMPGLPADTAATRRAQEFMAAYQEYAPQINQQSGRLQGAVRDITGDMPGPMGVMSALSGTGVTASQRETILSQFGEVGTQAEKLLSMGRRVSADIGKNVIDPNAVDLTALQEATESTLLTNNPLGQNIVDLSAVGTANTKGGKAFLRQAMAMGLSQDVLGSGLIGKIRGALGARTQQAGTPIQDLRDIVSGGELDPSSVNFQELQQLLAPGTEGAEQVAEAFKMTTGAGIGGRTSASARNIFRRTPEILQLGQLAEQLSSMPGFEHLKGGSSKQEQQINPEVAKIQKMHFEELSEITQKLTKNFEQLERGQIKHSDALKIETDLLQQREKAKQGQILTEKAAPLIDAGLLRSEVDHDPQTGKRRLRYKRTGAEVSPDMYATSQAFDEQLLKTEGMQDTGGSDRLIGGVRPSFMRRVLGGFGMMYMRSLGNIITGGFGYGQQERIGMEDTFGVASARMAGTGYTPTNQLQVLQNRMALSGQAYNPALGMQMATAQSPFLQDMKTAGGAGLGTYALLQQAALWGGDNSAFAQLANGGLAIGSGGMKIGSGMVVGGVMAASMLAQSYAKSQDPEGLAYRIGTGGPASAFGFTDTLGAYMSGDLRGVSQGAATYKGIQQQLQTGGVGSFEDIKQQVSRQQGRNVLFGDFDLINAETAEGKAWYNQAIQKTLLEENPEFNQETIAKAYQFMDRSGMSQSFFPEVAAQFQAGYDETAVSAGLSAFGISIGAQNFINPLTTPTSGQAPSRLGAAWLQTQGQMTTQNIPQYEAGLQYVQQLGYAPEIMAQQYGMTDNQIIGKIIDYGGEGFSGMSGDLYRQRALNYTQMAQMGWNVEAPTEPTGPITAAEYGQQSYEEQRITQKTQQIQAMANQFSSNFGLSPEERQDFLGNMQGFYESGRMNNFMANVMGGASQMDPYAMTQMYTMQQPGGALSGIGPQIQPWQVSKDIWGPGMGDLSGMAVNLPAFTVSGQSHPLFGQLSQLLGQDFMQQLGGTGAGQAFLNGYQMEGTNMPEVAGMMGYQMYQADRQYELRQQQNALSNRGNELQMEYLPRIWGLQDQMRDLGYQNQMWQFGQQEEQLAMQGRHFYQNIGMQEYQSQLQRGWTRQDWSFQDETRSMQHGWRVEDFEEQRRFMTGRDRRVAERQMERENIMYGREGEQIDQQRQRQEELWGLEDERFEIQKAQYEETRAFQEEQIEHNRAYYQENFELQTQLTELQRELTMKQLELQRESIALQQQMAEEQHKMQQVQMAVNLLMLENQTHMEAAQASFGNISEGMGSLFEEWAEFLSNGGSNGSGIDSNFVPPQIEDMNRSNGSSNTTPPPTGGGGGGRGGHSEGLYASGGEFWVGENGPEKLTIGAQGPSSATRGLIQPTNADPWKMGTFEAKSQFKDTKKGATIIVQIGNEEIRRFVVDTIESEI